MNKLNRPGISIHFPPVDEAAAKKRDARNMARLRTTERQKGETLLLLVALAALIVLIVTGGLLP